MKLQFLIVDLLLIVGVLSFFKNSCKSYYFYTSRNSRTTK